MALKNLSKVVELPIEGTNRVLRMNFADKRFLARLLKLVNKYKSVDKEILAISEKVKAETDETKQAEVFLNELVKIQEDFKQSVNECFGFSVTDVIFGEDSLPDISDYADLFEQLAPYIIDARKTEEDKITALAERYGLKRVQADIASDESAVGSNV